MQLRSKPSMAPVALAAVAREQLVMFYTRTLCIHICLAGSRSHSALHNSPQDKDTEQHQQCHRYAQCRPSVPSLKNAFGSRTNVSQGSTCHRHRMSPVPMPARRTMRASQGSTLLWCCSHSSSTWASSSPRTQAWYKSQVCHRRCTSMCCSHRTTSCSHRHTMHHISGCRRG